MSTAKAPTLYHVRTMARASKALDNMVDSPACPSPPPIRPNVAVPFLWEDAPGKPKLRATLPSPAPADGGATGSARAAGAPARPVLLKLPPRLQAAEYSLSSSPNTVLHGPYSGGARTAAKVAGDHDDAAPARPALLKLPPRLQAAEYSLSSSPKTVLHGPNSGRGGNKPPRPLRRVASTASCVGGGLFGWRKGTTTASGSKKGYAVAPDASCSSPAASSASSSSSSSSSSSMSYFFDEHSGRGAQWRQADGREESEDGGEGGDDGGKGTVRIRRFRRNRSLPTMSGSHLWANIRKGVKQISPWSQKPT